MTFTQHAGTGSPAGRAIAQAALGLGLADPIALAADLMDVDPDAVDRWFTVAARALSWLGSGAGRLADAPALLAAGWSSPAPRSAVVDQRAAGQASRDIIVPQVQTAGRTCDTLRRNRSAAATEFSRAEADLTALGWPPGTDLLQWAQAEDRRPAVTAVLTAFTDSLAELGRRNAGALQEMASVLRPDPRDPVQRLTGAQVGPGGTTGTAGTTGAPATTGTAGGIDRDNLDRLAADLRSADLPTVMMALGVRAALDQARAAGGTAQLLVYESASRSGQGRAAVAVGDISTADTVVAMAPGIGNAPVNMTEGIADAATLRAAAQAQAPGDSTAVIAWYGYDVPLSSSNGVPVTAFAAVANATAALTDANARAGGALLAADVHRWRQWAPSTARFVAVGFSMGSTTVSAAAARGAELDDIVLLGSPGASGDVGTARDYPTVGADHTFVTSFDQDPVTADGLDLAVGGVLGFGGFPPPAGAYGPDPAAAEFGAQVVDVSSTAPDLNLSAAGFDPLTTAAAAAANGAVALTAHHQQSNYMRGESLQAIAAVVNGRYGQVPIKPGRQ